jgi:ADP-ribose pyrophosphatase YjhB (NUDIX family)
MKSKDPLFRSYRETGFTRIPPAKRLSDAEYSKVLSSVVFACAYVVPISRQDKRLYLAERRVRPAQGPWWIGGRIDPNHSPRESAMANFFRETKFEINPEQLELVAVLDFCWKDRAQEPTTHGCHQVGFIHAVDFTANDLQCIALQLDEQEYDVHHGLRPFDHAALIAENVHPATVDVYERVFGK